MELALILPVMMLLAVAVGDFGRIYASIIALESATREAADYGAFDEDNWDDGLKEAATREEMQRRACTAASSMPGYVPAAAPVYCTNPKFDIEDSEVTADYGEGPIPIIMVRGTFTFTTAISFPPIPDSVLLVRESRFAVWEIDPLASEGPTDPPISAPPSIVVPTDSPSPSVSADPSTSPDPSPSAGPTPEPSPAPTPDPTPAPTPDPTPAPTPEPTPEPPPDPTPDPPTPAP